jgi:hypothetical protein
MKRMYRAGTLNRENLIDQAPGMWGRAYYLPEKGREYHSGILSGLPAGGERSLSFIIKKTQIFIL